MTSTVITPVSPSITLPIPPSFVGKKVEVKFVLINEDTVRTGNSRLSDKYRGAFTAEDAKSFDNHTRSMRNEWQTS